MDIDYDALFDLESENTEEVAETPETDDSVETGEEPVGAKESDPAAQTVEQTKEERAAHAAARRKAEEDARVSKGVDDAIASLGLVNPYTGKAITNRAEFDEYGKATQKERKDKFLDDTGVSEEELNRYVSELPEVREAKQMKADMERQRQQSALDAAISEIGKIDPSVKTLDDLKKHPSYAEVYNLSVHRGYSIPDAFKLANFDSITQRATSAAKQSALNSAASKSHLTATTGRGEGSVDVPSDVMATYKLLNPKATDAEIRAHYNKYHKKG